MQIQFGELSSVREKHEDATLVLAMGGFDLTHAGHALFFEDCKKQGDILVVGVASDAVRKNERGLSRPVLNEYLRVKMVDSLKPVDYAFLMSRLPREGENIMAPADDVITALRPDKWVVNQDAYDLPRREALAKQLGFELVVLERSCPPEFENISTTGIIKKIKEIKE